MRELRGIFQKEFPKLGGWCFFAVETSNENLKTISVNLRRELMYSLIKKKKIEIYVLFITSCRVLATLRMETSILAAGILLTSSRGLVFVPALESRCNL
jgi:hypothetical protein